MVILLWMSGRINGWNKEVCKNMSMTYLMMIIMSMGFIAIIILLDDWSTRTLLLSRKKLVENSKLLRKTIEKDKREGVERYELNPIGRFFLRRYGTRKGITFFNFLMVFPLLLFFFLGMVYNFVHPISVLFVFFFYFGAIVSQVRRACFIKKEIYKMEVELCL